MSEHSPVFGIDSHARTTTVCTIVVKTGETATRTFPGVSPYGNDGWVQSAPSNTVSACGAAMVKRRTAHLFIGFLRKTVLFPWTEPLRLRGSRGFFWALGAVSLRGSLL